MDFGEAIRALKDGKRVARAGWNGKGMWLGLVRGDGQPPEACSWSFTNGKWDNYSLASFIAMKTADDGFVPWLASQTDMLAEDWTEVT